MKPKPIFFRKSALLLALALFASTAFSHPYLNGVDVGGQSVSTCGSPLLITTSNKVIVKTSQWQEQKLTIVNKLFIYTWVDISRANSDQYIPTASGKYRCIFSYPSPILLRETIIDTTDIVTVLKTGVENVTKITYPTESCTSTVTLGCDATTTSGVTVDWKRYYLSKWTSLPGTVNTLKPTFNISDINNYYVQVSLTNACGTKSVMTTGPVSITQLNTESVSISATSKNICLNETATISAIVANANKTYQPSYTYTWAYSADAGVTWTDIVSTLGIYSNYNSKDLSIKTADASINNYQYRCTVKGKCATVTSSPCKVSVKTPPSFKSLTAEKFACKGTNVTATAVLAGDSPVIKWITSSDEQIANALTLEKQMPSTDSTSFTFSAEVSSAYCISTDKASVNTTTYPALRTVQTSRNEDCSGMTKVITAVTSGGLLPYTYEWSNGGATTQEISVTSPGTYSVTTTDACSNTSTSNFLLNTLSVPFIAASVKTDVTCNGNNNGSIVITASGGTSPYSLLWTDSRVTDSVVAVDHLAPNVFTDLSPDSYQMKLEDFCGATQTISSTITEPTELNSTVSEYTDAVCNGKGDGTATASVSGGTAPYTYIWDNGQRTPKAIGLMAGNYIVNVVDKNACLSTASVSIDEPQAFSASAFVSDITCHGKNTGAINIDANGGTVPYKYVWSNNLTDMSSDQLTAGDYTITVSDFCEDTKILQATIDQPDAFSISTHKYDINCYSAANGRADVSVTGGTAPYSYFWSDSVFSANRDGLDTLTYYVRVSDACQDTLIDSVRIYQPQELNVTISATNANCNGSIDGAATALPNGGTAPYSYLWSNGQKTQSAENLFAGTYSVQVIDANNCLASAQVQISEPKKLDAKLSSTNISCRLTDGGTISVSATEGKLPYMYEWSDTVGHSAEASGLAAGQYTVMVSDACLDTLILATEITEPAALSVTVDTVSVRCNGEYSGAISLTVTGGKAAYLYQWNEAAQTGNSLTNIPAGNYAYSVTDACGDLLTGSTTLAEPQLLEVSVTKEDARCYGQASGWAKVLTSGGRQPYMYRWDINATTDSVADLFARTYSYAVYDSRGCSTSGSVQIGQPQELSLSISTLSAACKQNTGSAEATVSGGTEPYSYLWNNASDTNSISTVAAGKYSLTVTDANACSTTANAEVGIAVKQYPICIVTVDTASKSNRVVWQKDNDASIASWNIYSYYGQFRKIGNVAADAKYSFYDDFMAKPRQTSHQYAITTLDKCGNESPLSYSHSTMLMWSNFSTEPNKANIEWTPYVDESGELAPANYYIYKGLSYNAMQLIDSVPGNSSIYIDESNDGARYYRVGFKLKNPCMAVSLKSDSGPYSQSLSNLSEAIILTTTVNEEQFGFSIDISPVPAADNVTITVENKEALKFELSLSDLYGNVTVLATEISQTHFSKTIDVSGFNSGTYLLQLISGETVITRKIVVLH